MNRKHALILVGLVGVVVALAGCMGGNDNNQQDVGGGNGADDQGDNGGLGMGDDQGGMNNDTDAGAGANASGDTNLTAST
ncbi:MAG TPA: hypothetical protein VNZ52_04610 [Candidatus Thermoplasmatota archaeon]|nr:hypothetical protein [Candidatus Thermoplasmatota archaeon]